jgi:hypothetical protein
VLCDDGSSICHVDSKRWTLLKCVAGAHGYRRFGGIGVPIPQGKSVAGPFLGLSAMGSRIDGVGFTIDLQCDHARPPHSSREMVDIDPSDVGQSLLKGGVVRHSKVRVSMTAMGHGR